MINHVDRIPKLRIISRLELITTPKKKNIVVSNKADE